MNFQNQKFNFSKLPVIYREFFQEFFPRATFSEDTDAVQVRLCNLPDIECISLSDFYTEYCNNNDYTPDEKECNRLFRQVTCEDPAESELATAIIFGLPEKYNVLKKCLQIYTNFLNLENVTSRSVAIIQIINAVISTSEVMPIDQLKAIASESDFNLPECVKRVIDIHDERYSTSS